MPLELREANALVSRWHRHHKPAQGHRFSVGVYDTKSDMIVGAVIVGRPVAQKIDHRMTLEVTRLVTNGTRNACSILYAAAARIGKEMGYQLIQTYILDTESGISLKAAGWQYDGIAGGGQWKHTDGKPRRTDQPTCLKGRWIKNLASAVAGIQQARAQCVIQIIPQQILMELPENLQVKGKLPLVVSEAIVTVR